MNFNEYFRNVLGTLEILVLNQDISQVNVGTQNNLKSKAILIVMFKKAEL